MTVHAAKGLEFPVVFIVNLSRGTGNWRDAIRIGAETAEDVSVSVGDFESPADEDAVGRDLEETKRLLYVALTRARDRLYLGSVVKDGRFQPGRGSLGEVLPLPVQSLFVEAAAGLPAVGWTGPQAAHALTVVPAATAAAPGEVSLAGVASSVESDFAVLDDVDPPPVSASASVGLGRESRRGRRDDAGSDRLIGTLVHRLLQREPIGSGASDEQLRRTAVVLLEALPVPDVEDVEATLDEVVTRVRALSGREDLRELFLTGRPFHELPFTMQRDGRTVRGTIDCLVASGEGRIVVLEFKTGKPRPEHEAQVAIYRAAAEALFPESRVETRLVYTSEAPVS